MGVPDAGKLKIYVPLDEAKAGPVGESTQTALAQRIAESVIGETMVWTRTRAGQVNLTCCK